MISADKILHELETYIYSEVSKTHGEKKALASSRALSDCLWLNFRKGLMYVPTTDKAELTNRYEAIWHDFTGHNHQDLAVKYRISLQQIYKIINKMQSSNKRKYQLDLFPPPEEKLTKPTTLFVIEEQLPNELIRCGLASDESIILAKKISIQLCLKFPGVSVCISDALKKKRQNQNQSDLFN